jgi:hypothetical protein
MARLKGVTPDQIAAETARGTSADVLYGQAYAADRMRRSIAGQSGKTTTGPLGEPIYTDDIKIPQIEALRNNPIIEAAAKEARILMASDPKKYGNIGANPMESLEGLHLMKIAIDNRFKDPTSATALQNYNKAALASTKETLLGAMEKLSPQYEQARRQFSEMSPPVNQSKVLQEMASVLQKPTGGERVTPFMNALGRGEQSLLKRSTGFPRYESGDLSKVLSPDQMDAVKRIEMELLRDQGIADRVPGGLSGALRALRAGELKDVKAPSLVDARFAFFNRMLNILEGTGGEKSEKALAELMLPGNASRLGALMRMQMQNPQGVAGTIVKSQSPVIHNMVEE